MSSILTTCYICKSAYVKPKVLSCYHTFCQSCLQEKYDGQSLTTNCVVCDRQSVLPRGGITDLPSNPFVQRIMQNLSGDVKSDQSGPTRSNELHANLTQPQLTADHGDFEENSVRTDCHSMTCASPCNRHVSVYCKTCEIFICTRCAEMEHLEHYQSVCTLQDLTAECEQSLLQQADGLEAKMLPLQNTLREITHVLADLGQNRDASRKRVKESFDLLVATINYRRTELLKNIDDAYNEKQSKLVKQADSVERRIRNIEEGLDVILLSLCPKQTNLTSSCVLEEENCNHDAGSNFSASDASLFFIHKQVSNTLSGLCNAESGPFNGTVETNDSLPEVSTHQRGSMHDHECIPISTRLNFPCENSHIKLTDMHDLTEINRMASNLGCVETSHAVAEKCELIGESITTGYCRVREENSIVLTTKTWSGSLETTGKVEVSVNIEYIGPPDKRDLVAYRSSLRTNRSRSAAHRISWDGSRLPVSSSSYGFRSNPGTPRKRTVKMSKGARTPPSSDRRSPLKDLFFPRSPEASDPIQPLSPTEERNSSMSIKYRVDYIKNGAYEITFTPSTPGKIKISVDVSGKPIQDGSFVVTAVNIETSLERRQLSISERESAIPTRFRNTLQKAGKPASDRKRITQKNLIEDDLVCKVGCKGRLNGQFSNPQGISVDHLGRLIVADSSNQCMQTFTVDPKKSREQRFLFKFGEKGRGNHQVQRPTGIYGLPNGDVAVSDYDNKVVKIYGENGKHKRNIGAGKLMGPKGVCLDKNGRLVVVDNKLCQIMIFQMNGRLVTKFGSRGTEPHELAGPHFVAVNNENFYYVSDFYNHCVKVFSSQGDCLDVIGSSGEGCGQFNAPTGLAIDSRGNIIIADWGNSRLQVFDKQGSFLSCINTKEDPLYGPQGVTMLSDDFVAVADSGNQCVKIYSYLQ